MFKLTNISSNPQELTKGRIAAGDTVEVESVGERERFLERRGWLRIITAKQRPEAPAKAPVVEQPKQDPVEPKADEQPKEVAVPTPPPVDDDAVKAPSPKGKKQADDKSSSETTAVEESK